MYLCRVILSDRSIRRRLTTKICIVVGRGGASRVNRRYARHGGREDWCYKLTVHVLSKRKPRS